MSKDGGNPDYRPEQHAVEIATDFASGREALLSFGTHSLDYMFLHPPGARVELGRDVIVCARIAGVWTVNPCRIVYLEESEGLVRYGYGTLPGHSEHGEEMFSVERLGPNRIRAETIAYSRSQDVIARIGWPIARYVQARVKRDYLRALARPRASPIPPAR